MSRFAAINPLGLRTSPVGRRGFLLLAKLVLDFSTILNCSGEVENGEFSELIVYQLKYHAGFRGTKLFSLGLGDAGKRPRVQM